MTFDERFERLFSVISGKRFLNREGLGNELPFFIFSFEPSDYDRMLKRYDQLIRDLGKKGVRLFCVDVYDLSVELLRNRDGGIWDRIIEVEKDISKDEMKELLQGVLSPEDHLVPLIEEKAGEVEYDVMFMTGLGEVFPYLRTHHILTNLQRIISDKPVVIFFPGVYKQSDEIGASLELFSEFSDDNYYRAFDIDNYEA